MQPSSYFTPKMEVEKMSKKEKIWAIVVSAFCVAITLILMFSMYNAGRNKGREETVQMVNELASNYTFSIKDNDGWQLGSSKGGDFFPTYDASLGHSYDWDDCKINLWYEKIK